MAIWISTVQKISPDCEGLEPRAILKLQQISLRTMPAKFQPNLDFLRQAISLATRNVTSGNGGPFGAVVVRDGKVIAEGVNIVTATKDPTAHGEVTAIRNACRALNSFSLEGCELYSSCEPCPMCLAASHW